MQTQLTIEQRLDRIAAGLENLAAALEKNSAALQGLQTAPAGTAQQQKSAAPVEPVKPESVQAVELPKNEAKNQGNPVENTAQAPEKAPEAEKTAPAGAAPAAAEKPVAVTARAEALAEEAKKLAPSLQAKVDIQAAYVAAKKKGYAEPIGAPIVGACKALGFNRFSEVPDDRMPDLVTAVRELLTNAVGSLEG